MNFLNTSLNSTRDLIPRIKTMHWLLLCLGFSSTAIKADDAFTGTLWRGATYTAIAGLAYTNAFKSDHFNLSVGALDRHDAVQLEFNFRYHLGESMDIFSQTKITPFLDVGYASWQELLNGIDMANRGNAFNLTPGVRFNFPRRFFVIDFIDARVGVSLIAPSFFENRKGERLDFGGHFSFNEELALGGYFTDQKNWEWQLAVHHYSNHNIYNYNASIDFIKLRIGYNY
jgi:hypothetical protein